jgi:hypothetical protein
MFSENDFNKILVGIQSNLKQKNTKYYMSALGLKQYLHPDCILIILLGLRLFRIGIFSSRDCLLCSLLSFLTHGVYGRPKGTKL